MDILSVKNTLADFLKEKKLRPTRERFLVLEEIMHTNGHFDADELFSLLNAKGLKASRATVYNTLDLLVECGIISKYRFGEHQSKYEKAIGRPRHDHLICLECGDILEFVNERLTKIQREVCEEKSFQMQNATLQIFGMCARCQSKKKRQA
jgi:Fur family ferric uptake transcriptional regulator